MTLYWISLIVLVTVLLIELTCAKPLLYTGVNESGGEFSGNKIPGVLYTDYTYPSLTTMTHLHSIGMNIFRLQFLWERAQPNKTQPLSSVEIGRIRTVVNQITNTLNSSVLLDPHNYARYYGQIIGAQGSNVTAADFRNFWNLMAIEFKNNSRVIFGLMNEPNNMLTVDWLADANAAISGIRAAGAKNLILVPGNYYTGAVAWSLGDSQGVSNAQVMGNITDSGNNFAIEAHQYLDSYSSGTSPNCTSTSIGVSRLTAFTSWCRARNFRAFLGEFAGGDNPTCQQGIENMLNYMENNTDVWIGWTWWTAGPWYGDYMYNLEPVTNGTGFEDRPQIAWLSSHLAGKAQVNPSSSSSSTFPSSNSSSTLPSSSSNSTFPSSSSSSTFHSSSSSSKIFSWMSLML